VDPLDTRPIIITIAGPNGAGKSTFYETFLLETGLPFVNADNLAREASIDAYEASEAAERMREELARERQSFVFETVFSDPVGAKVEFLRSAQSAGYTIVLCFIGLESADLSDDRVAIRVLQGGHDVAKEKIQSRYPRSLDNLRRAIATLQYVRVYDNSDLTRPYRKLAEYEQGKQSDAFPPLPLWFASALKKSAPKKSALKKRAPKKR
jgi:predicted ABC-type ATPase